jgi:hypothetical protein
VDVLDVEKVAIFVEDERAFSHYRIAKSIGLSETFDIPPDFRLMIREKSPRRE